MNSNRHGEERSDVAIHEVRGPGLPRYARNDSHSTVIARSEATW
ncbi:hypothetical protein [Rhodoferax sp.]